MRWHVYATVLLMALGALGLDATPARAQPWDDRPNLLPRTPHGIWGELTLYGRGANGPDPSVTVASPVLHGYFGLGRHFELGFSWGLGYHEVGDQDEVVAGNPYVAARYVWRKRQHRVRLGGGVAFPVGSADLGGGRAGLEGAARGWWSMWLWWPHRLTFVVPELRWELHAPVIYLAAEGALGILVHTGGGDGDPELATQVAGELGFRLAERFILGIRLQAVGILTEGGDNAQVAMAPFAQIEFGHAFVFSRFLMNLDHPLGFAFDDRGVWGFTIGAGGRF